MDKNKLLAVARGDSLADLVIKNAKIINVFSKTIEEEDIAITDGIIVGVGNYHGKKEIDYKGYYVSPGFIDGHVHIESSMLTPNHYALSVMPKGTTSVIADCHEIANVAGIDGIDFMLKASQSSPLEVFMMIPSCVPSTEYETAGAKLLAKDIKKYATNEQVLGLGEMMNYTGAIQGDLEVLSKINSFNKKTIDGHAPEVYNKDLNAYILAGVKTDHECTKPEELLEKVKRGMYIHLREGSQTKNVLDLLPGVKQPFYDRILFCSDDLHPSDIRKYGHIDNNINLAIHYGVEPISAISMATINVANCYKLKDIGAVAPGYIADLVFFKDLNHIDVEHVYKSGKQVVKNKKVLFETKKIDASKVLDTVSVDFSKIDLTYKLSSNLVNVIGLIKNNVTTKKIVEKVNLDKGKFEANINDDLLKLCVIERYHLSGNIGKGIVKGYGLKNGALAMTISHDSHNLVCIGDNDKDMLLAIKKITDIGGGIVLASRGEIIELLPLEVGGLMSLKPSEFVEEKLNRLEIKIRKLGVKREIEDPFLQLGFLSLAVIPEIRVTDKGLFDAKQFKIIPLEASDSNEL
ncbi:MAG: adenine deaminase [Candidatus Izimaplasma sp.]|nr:adenine deaminase [Candidatus Izimaplasma bacterium]